MVVLHYTSKIPRRVWRYQRGNQNPYISKKNRQHNGQKKKVQKDKQRSTKDTHKTKNRVRIPVFWFYIRAQSHWKMTSRKNQKYPNLHFILCMYAYAHRVKITSLTVISHIHCLYERQVKPIQKCSKMVIQYSKTNTWTKR